MKLSLILLLMLSCLSARMDRAVAQAAPRRSVTIERLHQDRSKYVEQFQSGISRLLETCREQKLDDAVSVLMRWQTPVDGAQLRGLPLPKELQPDIPSNLSLEERTWRITLRKLREETGQDFYLLSRRALNAGSPSLAWQLIREAAWYNPDHDKVRQLLGYERFDHEWTTPFAAAQLKKKLVWNDQYGWLPATHVPRYENGERYYRGQWIPEQREAEFRRDFKNAWQVETDNFLLKTNISLEAGVAIARKLEVFHTFFRQSYPAFFDSPEQLQKLFQEGSRPNRKRQTYEVHVFRTKAEYVERLIKENPLIEITNGIYMPGDRTAFFFDNPEGIDESLSHEATHQFLFERFPKQRPIAEQEHFWIIEGLACYMESFRATEQGEEIGSVKNLRMQSAQHRLITENYYVPLARFAAAGKNAFQNDPNIRANYSQATGLSYFFMDYEDGRYRDAFIEHITALYDPKAATARVRGLDALTGVPYEQLDQQYRSYITGLVTE